MSSKIKPSSFSRLLLAIILVLILLFVTGGGMQSLAASGIWQGTVSNIWNNDANWTPEGYPNASGEIAFFDGGSVPTNVIISSTQVTVGGMIIVNDNGYTIAEENGGSLLFESGSTFPATVYVSGQASHTISAPVQLDSNLSMTNASSGNLTFSGDISEASGEAHYYVGVRSGSPLVFLGENTYSGGTNIRGGTLLLGGNDAAGSGSISLLCSSNPCNTPGTPATLGNLSADTVLQNPLIINHSFVQFSGPSSMSFTSLDSILQSSAKVVITGTLNLAKLQDPTEIRSLRRSGPGTLNLNITPEGTNIGNAIRSDPGSGQMNLYGSGSIGRIYYRDGSGGGTVGIGDQLDVVTGELTRSTGVLTVTGVLQTGTNTPGQADRVLSFDLGGIQPGSGYDQIVVQEMDHFGLLSAARITDTVLSVAVDPDFNPPVDTEFTLIQRTGGDGTSDDMILGTFRDLPEGNIFLVDDLAFQIHYTADTVTLIRCENPILTVTGGSPQSTLIGTSFKDRLEVTAQYPDQTPVVGLKVYFTAPTSGPSATFTETMPILTGPDGKASVAATANMLTGSYEVTAETNHLFITPVKFQLTNLTAGPAWLDVSGFPSPVRAGETGVFTVTVRNQWNQLVSDYIGTIAFSSSDARATLPENYTFTLTDAGQHAFTAVFLTASLDNFLRATDTVTDTLTGEQTGIEVLPADPAKIDVIAGTPQTAQVGTAFTSPLVVRVTDAYSNTVPGMPVTYTGPVIGAGMVYTGTNPVSTDLTGQASLIAGPNTTSGSYQVTASVETMGVLPVYFDLTNTPAPVVGLNVFGYPSPVKAGSIHPFTVSAVDQYGNVNPNYRGSTYSLSSDPLAILPQDYLFTAQDAGSHVFNATLKTSGTHYITMVDNRGLRGTQSGILVESLGPARLEVDIYTSQPTQSTQILAAFPKPLAVILVDQYGNPQSGFVITFTVPSNGASAILMGANPQQTGSDGRVSLRAAANPIAGSYEVLVATNAPGVTPIKFMLTNLPGPAANIIYKSGSLQFTPVGKVFLLPLIVEVTDAYDNFVPGAWVIYSAPSNGPSCSFENGGQVQTGADGRASMMATANMNVGSYTVEARLVGVLNPALFNLTNQQSLFLSIISR